MTLVLPPAEERRALIVLLGVIFLMIAGFGLVIPLLPFFAQAFDAPAWQVTLLFSAFSVGQFIGEPFWGKLSDRIGRRPVLIITISMVGLSYAALAFAPNILVAFGLRFLTGIFAGNISTLQGALADITPPEKRAQRMGIMGSAFSAGFMTGPAIGGFLAQPSRGALGFQLPLLVAAGFALASALAVVLFVRESRPTNATPQKRVRSAGLREGFAHPIVSRVILISFIVVVGFAGIEATYGLWTEARFGWGPRQIGFAFMAIGLLGAICQGWLSGRLARAYGEARTLTGGLAFMGVGLIVQGASPTWHVAVLGFALVCIGQSICFPNISALISRAAPPDRQGEMLGLNMSGMALARIGGPVMAGQLFSLVAPGAPFAFSALLILPALWFAWAVIKRTPRLA
ncbi:MAG: MFS transporter [Alphaproteobacteria bacterium]|nr:MFS transporter [Alphaproteobacteria bacterium]MBU1514393.1 MFS transporter [Alphaproteobacteria bacterium]MBU2096037.1 MFS transporter [Alphaproteobacteria bacterium]MBU2150079.1 MFS transporter [Alphaproteobacteria bacterium]MBU2308592.1 MFS transporter [Alphaproteobacteria bacterium]